MHRVVNHMARPRPRTETMSKRCKTSQIRIGQAKIGRAVLALGLLFVGMSHVHADTGSDRLVATAQVKPPSGARSLCGTYYWACASSGAERSSTEAELNLLTRVNAQVNSAVREVSDLEQYRKAELWALPTAEGGDCEDFALMKKNKLIREGIEPSRLLLATVLDRKRRPHAVLVYRGLKTDFVLDNTTNRILTWRDTGYIFLRMQDPKQPSRWVGGFLQS